MTIGETIKATREDRGLTRKEVAEQTGLGVSTLEFIENDRGHTRLDSVLRIADVLNVSLDELTGRSKSSRKRVNNIIKKPSKAKYQIFAKRIDDEKWSKWNMTNDINRVVENVNRIRELGYLAMVKERAEEKADD